MGNFESIALSINEVEKESSCTICLEEFKSDDDVTEMTCNSAHIFHPDCLKLWLERNFSCPTCRTEINSE